MSNKILKVKKFVCVCGEFLAFNVLLRFKTVSKLIAIIFKKNIKAIISIGITLFSICFGRFLIETKKHTLIG